MQDAAQASPGPRDGTGADITLLRPARAGEVLTAAAERFTSGRSGIRDATVSRGDGEVAAGFRGRSRTLG